MYIYKRNVVLLFVFILLLFRATEVRGQGSLPSGWLDQDIGSVGLTGNASYTGGVFTVSGAGQGFFSSSDGFHFAYQPISGDATIVARVVTTSSVYTQAGVMIRETLDANAKSSLVMDDTGHIYSAYRTSTGGNNTYASAQSGGAIPYWVKLVRSGNTFTTYMASDGVNWVQAQPSQSINMAQNVYIGLAVSSGTTGHVYTATFDNVSVSTAANPAPVISTVSATTGSAGTQLTISGSGFGASQGNSLATLNNVAMAIGSWSDTSITVTIPTGAVSGYIVVSVAPSMNDSNPVVFTVTANPLPSGWLDQDIGAVYRAGNASYANGVFTVQTASSGFDPSCGTGLNPDAFHFVYQPLSGDGTIVARVANPSTFAQGGIMFRETLDAKAKTVFMADPSSSDVLVWYRTLGGANTGCVNTQTPGPWLKLERIGNSFSEFQSNDGINWVPIGGTLEVSMAQNVYVGLAMGVGSSSSFQTGYLDNVSVTSTTLAPPVITSVSATTGPIGSQVTISGSGFGASQGSSVVLLNAAPVTINSWSDTSITVTIPAGATSGVLAVLVGPSMNSSNPVAFTITSQPLPSGWFDRDIGKVVKTGNASYANGVFTVQGAGAYLGGTTDAFHFVYQPMSTSGTIIARVTGGTSGELAVLIRETLDVAAASIGAGSFTGSSVSPSMYYRPILGGYELTVGGGPGLSLPYWMKVVRNVNLFGVYVSPDGITWTQVGTTQTFTTPETVYVGLGVHSGNTGNLATVTFDNVSVSPGGSLSNPVITGISPTAGRPGATATVSGTGFGATQGTSQLNFNGAIATISSWSDAQIVALVPDAATTGPVMVTVGNITYQGPMFTAAFNTQVTDSLGNQTSFVSLLAGGQWSLSSAQGSGCSSCTTRGTVQNLYDPLGNLLAVTDALGNTTTYTYDSSNNLASQAVQLNATTTATTTYYGYNAFGEVTGVTDPLSNSTSNTYDSHGNLLTVTTPSPGGGVAGSVTTFTYDTKGELLTIKDPLNNVTTLTYTPVGLIATITDAQSNVTTYAYDAHGNRTSVTDALNKVTTFAYDAGDRLTTITYPDTTTTTFGYDYRGRRTSVTDQNGKITIYAYDDADRLTSVTDAASNVTTYAYDTENNLTSIKDANTNTTTFVYDAFRRVIQTTFPSGNTETYSYDADNNLTTKTDRNGHTITYTYDLANRLTNKSYPDSTSVAYTYDKGSRLTQVADPTGTYTFVFDNMGRLTSTTTNYTFLTSRAFTTGYAYDKASNRAGFTDPESGATTYAYDTLNRLTTLTPPAAISSGSFGFGYDALSRRTSLTRPNNVTTNYAYDNLSRLQSVLHQLAGSTIDGTSYTVDNAGNRTSKTDQGTSVTTNYGYDQIYQLLSATGGSTSESYTYDPVGNRLSSIAGSWSNNTSNELTASPTASYGYDNNGNTLTKTDSTGTINYSWDFDNRLTSVTLPGSGGTVSYRYDPFGRRIYKSSSSGTSIYTYDWKNLTEETNAAGVAVSRYTHALNVDEPLAQLRSGTTSYYEADGLGSVTSLSNTAGVLAQTYTFDSFGNQTASSGSLTNPFQFTSREFDAESNLYFYRARYYDPKAGRFLSEDPTSFLNGIDFYNYVGNSPVQFIDPSGTELQWDPRETWNDYKNVGLITLIRSGLFAHEAANAAAEWAKQHLPLSATLHNDPADAFRHCFWSCNMTKYLGEDVAETIADEHEKRNNRLREQTPDEEKMDRANNLAGRTAALACNNKKKNCWDICSDLASQHRLYGLGGRPDYFPGVPGHANQ